jgi:hypothetical protein
MSDTPRSDRWLKNINGWHYVHIERSRELEQELNAANERIKRLEEAGDVIKASLQRSLNSNEQGECKWLAELPMTDAEFAVFTTAFKAKEANP